MSCESAVRSIPISSELCRGSSVTYCMETGTTDGPQTKPTGIPIIEIDWEIERVPDRPDRFGDRLYGGPFFEGYSNGINFFSAVDSVFPPRSILNSIKGGSCFGRLKISTFFYSLNIFLIYLKICRQSYIG